MRTKPTILLLLFSLLVGVVSTSYAAPTYKLYVTTAPKDADIRIMNIKPKFYQGIELEQGSYDLLIAKEGYQPFRKWIGIRNKDRRLHFELEPEEIQTEAKHALTIITEPKNARIYVMNIRERFEQGLELPSGKYDVMITARGFSPKRQWVDIVDQDTTVKVVLGKPEEIASQVENTVNNIVVTENTNTTVTQDQSTSTADDSIIKTVHDSATSILKRPSPLDGKVTVIDTTHGSKEEREKEVDNISEFIDENISTEEPDDIEVDGADLDNEDMDGAEDIEFDETALDDEDIEADVDEDMDDAEDVAMSDEEDEEDIADEDIDSADDDVADEDATDDEIDVADADGESEDMTDSDEETDVDEEDIAEEVEDDSSTLQIAQVETTPVTITTEVNTSSTQEESEYALTVDTVPSDANIHIMTIKPKFYQGIKLTPGDYDIWVKKDKLSIRRWITVTDHDVHLNVNLNQDTFVETTPEKRYKLTVNTVPEDARVLIMNIVPKFHQGILLTPGKYDLLVKKPGYPKLRQWISVENSDVEVNVVLGDADQETVDEEDVTSLASVDDEDTDDVSDDETDVEEEVVEEDDIADEDMEDTDDVEEDTIEENSEVDVADVKDVTEASSKPVQKYALTIKTTPDDAKVEIQNIPQSFAQGMLLPPGKYLVHTSKAGYPLRRDWAIVEDQNVTMHVVLSKQSLCFFSEEISENVGQSYSVVRSAKVKFRGSFVDVSYYEHSIPAGLSDHLEFQGIQKGEMLELIATVEKGGQLEEVEASMKLQDNQLWVDVNGSQGVLESSTCF